MSINADIADQVEELELNAPKVDYTYIQSMMEEVYYETYVVPTTTTTIAVAIYRGFTLTTASASCVDPANFNEKLGKEAAIKRAAAAAETELWKLEGWMLHRDSTLCINWHNSRAGAEST